MNEQIETNQGEIKIHFKSPHTGKVTLAELGLEENSLFLENGLLRLVLDLKGLGDHKYYNVPTIEIAYKEEVGETHWQCDFNRTTILDKMDHHGHVTVLLLNRKKIKELEQRHENNLIVHAEFPQAVHIDANKSYLNLFQ